jgi:phospholipid/cholesterol/gamma-HCH transport system permease protein
MKISWSRGLRAMGIGQPPTRPQAPQETSAGEAPTGRKRLGRAATARAGQLATKLQSPRLPRWLRRLGASLLIGGQSVSAIARLRIGRQDLIQELLEAGPGSFLIVLITALASGTVFNIQVAAELSKQGASAAIGGLLALGLSREIAPLLTATLLTGKVATAYAAQLGTMKVTEQIDAITMLRTDPVEYLVVPRVLAMVIMAPVQCLVFFLLAIWSGQVSSTLLYGLPPSVFWNSMRTWMEPSDVPAMLFKALVFGLLIAVLACGWGLTTRGGPKEVGSSTTGAVVMILVAVALMDVVLTQVLFGI